MRSLLVEHGAWVWKVAMLVLALVGLAIVRGVRDSAAKRRVRDEVAARKSHVSAPVLAKAEGIVALAGTLRGGLATTLVVGEDAYHDRAGEVWIDVAGERLELGGPVHVVRGTAVVAARSRHPWERHASARVVLPVAFALVALLGFAVRRARVFVTRDGVRWGWDALNFTQERSRIARAHVWKDGVTLEANRGSWWFLSARDWDRFDALVRQLRRADLPIEDHDRTAPLRARLQSYGRFLDGLLVLSMLAAFGVMLWAA